MMLEEQPLRDFSFPFSLSIGLCAILLFLPLSPSPSPSRTCTRAASLAPAAPLIRVDSDQEIHVPILVIHLTPVYNSVIGI